MRFSMLKLVNLDLIVHAYLPTKFVNLLCYGFAARSYSFKLTFSSFKCTFKLISIFFTGHVRNTILLLI